MKAFTELTTPAQARTHACNCIGCCRKCGQCRTAPWHAATCDRIAALNREHARVIESA